MKLSGLCTGQELGGVKWTGKFKDKINILTGSSATGKSFLLRKLRDYLEFDKRCSYGYVDAYSAVNGKTYADVVGEIGAVDVCLIDNTDLYLTDHMLKELDAWCKCMILSRHDLSGIVASEEVGLYFVRPSDDGFLVRSSGG